MGIFRQETVCALRLPSDWQLAANPDACECKCQNIEEDVPSIVN